MSCHCVNLDDSSVECEVMIGDIWLPAQCNEGIALLWQVAQRRLVVSCRRFGTTSRSNLPLIPELLDPRILGRCCVPKRR
jgi:hypothetical protein